MKALVTGGAGFIGSNLAIDLEGRGHEVTILDNFSFGHADNMQGFKGRVIQGDVSKPITLGETFDVIFHEAAITDPRFPDDGRVFRENGNGFKNVLELALANGAKLIYASSASQYGNGPIPMREGQPMDLLSAYARSKSAMDALAADYFGKMHIVGLRYFNVFGSRESHKGRPASMIFHLSNQMKEGRRPRIFKWGEQKRGHIYVKDAVDATIKAADAKRNGVYNVGTGVGTDFNTLVRLLNEVLETRLEPEYFPNPYEGTYQKHTQADTSESEKYLGFKAGWRLKEAIADYLLK